jgi:hypothetical protein
MAWNLVTGSEFGLGPLNTMENLSVGFVSRRSVRPETVQSQSSPALAT